MLQKLKKIIYIVFASVMLLHGVPSINDGEAGIIVTAEAATKVALNTKNLTLAKGETYKLKISGLSKNTKISWSANNKNVQFTRSKDTKTCTVKGLRTGTTKITAKVNSQKYICTIKVVPALAQVKLGKISAKSNSVTLTWNKVSGATSYYIYYRLSGGKWKKITSVSASKTAYTHKSSSSAPLTAGKKYYYTVRAYNKNTKKFSSYNTKGLTITIKPSTPIRFDILNLVSVIHQDGSTEDLPFSDKILLAVTDADNQHLPVYAYRYYNAKWTSSNPNIATVEEKGYYCAVTKKSLGSTIIKAEPYDLDNTLSVTVTVDYSKRQKFADNFVQDWIKKNLNNTMTQYEKVIAIAKCVGSIPYGYTYDWIDGIMNNEPMDCFATRQMVAYMCTAAGIPAMACDAYKHHGRTVVKADNQFYEVITGYTGSEANRYTIWPLYDEELSEYLTYYNKKIEDFVPSNLAICDPSPHTCWDTKVSMAHPETIIDIVK